MNSNFTIKSTMGLRVTKPEKDTYIVWTPNYYGLINPKLIFVENKNGNVSFEKATGQFKGIIINSLVFCGVVVFSNFLFIKNPMDFLELTPLLMGIIGFMIFLNFLVLNTTKWKVYNKLFKKDRKNVVKGRIE